jgi:hypothetical protein
MENGFNCCICSGIFDEFDLVPIVLKCGDSACMNCLVQAASRGIVECFFCGVKVGMNFEGLKDLPVNKALVDLLKRNHVSRFKVEEGARVCPYLEEREMCKRKGCKNFKYEHLNVVYQFCSVKCMEEDQNEERLSENTF